MGRLEGAESYAESVAALRHLAPDSTVAMGWQWLAFAPHGALTVLRRTGTIRDGGAYEVEHLFLLTVERGRVTRLELFELEDVDAALARFEELQPDPSRIPPNAATRANDRAALAIAAGDRSALRALASPDFRFEDRGKRALVVGGGVARLGALPRVQHRARLEAGSSRLGDRVAVYGNAWAGWELSSAGSASSR
jgi:ketosteroid isomerase-like protein